MLTIRTRLTGSTATALISLATLAGTGFAVPASAAPAFNDPASVNKLMTLLSKGYTGADCKPVNTGDHRAIAKISCGPNHDPGGPAAEEWYLYSSVADMNAAFQDDIAANTVLPFPDGKKGPAAWSYSQSPNVTAGQSMVLKWPNGAINLEWTRESAMSIGTAVPAGDMAGLVKWWQAEG
jgi:serine/threonine-protein kinase